MVCWKICLQKEQRPNEYLQSLTNLTRVTGLSRKQIADSLKQQQAEGTFEHTC